MSDIAEHLAVEQCFAIEYEDKGPNRFMSVRFWKGQRLCRVPVRQSGLPATELTGELRALSRLLSVVAACSGDPADLIRTNDQSPSFAQGFRFEQLDLLRLMLKNSYSVFGHIDFFYALRGLMISLGGSHSEVPHKPLTAYLTLHPIHQQGQGVRTRVSSHISPSSFQVDFKLVCLTVVGSFLRP